MSLSTADIHARLHDLPGWSFRDNALVRQFTFASFAEAMTFVTRVAFDAEAHDHHPDLSISYRRVTVSWTTHDSGGVTEKDLAGAASSDRFARILSGS